MEGPIARVGPMVSNRQDKLVLFSIWNSPVNNLLKIRNLNQNRTKLSEPFGPYETTGRTLAMNEFNRIREIWHTVRFGLTLYLIFVLTFENAKITV